MTIIQDMLHVSQHLRDKILRKWEKSAIFVSSLTLFIFARMKGHHLLMGPRGANSLKPMHAKKRGRPYGQVFVLAFLTHFDNAPR